MEQVHRVLGHRPAPGLQNRGTGPPEVKPLPALPVLLVRAAYARLEPEVALLDEEGEGRSLEAADPSDVEPVSHLQSNSTLLLGLPKRLGCS